MTSSPRLFPRRAAIGSLFAALAFLSAAPAFAADVTVSAAASLTNAFKEIGAAFEAKNPGTKVLFNFAASDALLAQIVQGAPVDVFASADQETMDKADAQKLLAPGSRVNFAANSLVLIVPSDSKLAIAGVADLQQPAVKRIAIGAPGGVPAGRYAKSALEAAKLWSAVEPKAVYAQSVRQSLDYVARGEAEAGFVYATDAAIMKDKVKVAATVPTGTPISYPMAVIAAGPNDEGGKRFAAFVASQPGQEVLSRYGFNKP